MPAHVIDFVTRFVQKLAKRRAAAHPGYIGSRLWVRAFQEDGLELAQKLLKLLPTRKYRLSIEMFTRDLLHAQLTVGIGLSPVVREVFPFCNRRTNFENRLSAGWANDLELFWQTVVHFLRMDQGAAQGKT
jgi:hypothetical protein